MLWDTVKPKLLRIRPPVDVGAGAVVRPALDGEVLGGGEIDPGRGVGACG